MNRSEPTTGSDVLSTPGAVDSPCGPVLDEHCDCCGHRYVGDHVRGQVCPCESREGWDG